MSRTDFFCHCHANTTLVPPPLNKIVGCVLLSLETGIEADKYSFQNRDVPNLISIIQCCYLGTTLDFLGPIKIA